MFRNVIHHYINSEEYTIADVFDVEAGLELNVEVDVEKEGVQLNTEADTPWSRPDSFNPYQYQPHTDRFPRQLTLMFIQNSRFHQLTDR
jgi:hypothetical protein